MFYMYNKAELLDSFGRNWFNYNIWASKRENLFSEFANDKDADLPAHLRKLISAFVIRFLEIFISDPVFIRSEVSYINLLQVKFRFSS